LIFGGDGLATSFLSSESNQMWIGSPFGALYFEQYLDLRLSYLLDEV